MNTNEEELEEVKEFAYVSFTISAKGGWRSCGWARHDTQTECGVELIEGLKELWKSRDMSNHFIVGTAKSIYQFCIVPNHV